jgi:hypothetical protein
VRGRFSAKIAGYPPGVNKYAGTLYTFDTGDNTSNRTNKGEAQADHQHKHHMLKLHGKFVARWTGPDGKRHSKACKTKAAAAAYQRKMVRERLAKKARPTKAQPSKRSPRRGRSKPTGPSTAPSRATSSARSATSAQAT